MSEKLAELGLSANPFAADTPLESLFPGAMRRASLDQLQLLARESGDIIALIGPDGSGKSTLADFFARHAERDQVVARARASLLTTPSQLLQEMFKAFVLDFPPQASIAQLKQVLSLYFEAVRNKSRTVVLIVDDAHELGDDAFNLLTKLALVDNPGGTFHLILVGQVALIDMLDYTCPQKEGQNQFTSIRLPDFSLEETRNYLRYRLNAVGFNDTDPGRALPFSNRQIDKIHKLSAGVPAAINQVAGDALFSGGKGLAWLAPILQIKLPRNYAYAAGGLVFILLVAFLVGGGEEPVETAQRQITLPTPEARQSDPLPADQAPLPEVEEVLSSPFAEPEPESEPEPVAVAEVPAPVSSPPQSSSTRPSGGSTPAPVVTAPAAPVVTSQPASVAAAPAPPPAAQTVAATPARSAATAAPAVSSQSAQRERIMSFPGNQFTVQLLGARSRSNVEAFLERNSASPLYWFETQNQGRPWYVVILGNYPSRAAAQSAAAGLSGELGRLEPWVRSMSAVQSDVQSSN
jgi:DamX protein